MNVAEGARRMKHAGLWMVLFPLSALLLFVGVLIVAAFLPGPVIRYVQVAQLLVFPLPIAFMGAILWLAGWIVEGFAKDTH
jgi:hypothetical protein